MTERVDGANTKSSGSCFRIHRPNEIQEDRVREQLDRILAGRPFSRAERPGRFLKYLVEHALRGEAEKIDEYLLAVEVFGRKQDFDSGSDPIVRVEAGRLRRKLQDYYESEGREDPVVVELPQRTYVPVFRERPSAPAQTPAPRIRRIKALNLGIALLVVLILSVAYLAGIGQFPRPTVSAASGKIALAKAEFTPGVAIAVLPFSDLSPKRDEEYLCDGLAEEIAEALSEVKGVRVVSRTTASQFKNNAKDVRAIGKQLNAAFVLEGAVRKEGDRLRISVWMINTTDGYQVWSRKYDRTRSADFAVEEEIAQDAANRLAAALDIGLRG